jgi:hypothetical protein
VSIEDPNYLEICRTYKALSEAMRRGDLVTVLTTLDRDYSVVRPDLNELSRKDYEAQLRELLAEQIETDYREEPAHVVIRGRRAQVASRIFARTVVRRHGKLMELKERGEHLTTWVKTTAGWKREKTRIRFHEQDIEWLQEAQPDPEPSRVSKFLI